MEDLKLEVICENGKVEYFEKGILGAYFWIGHPTEWEKEPEYIIEVFFDESMKFRGILLLDEYKEELKDSFESIICCELPTDIEEYEFFSFATIENGEISVRKYDLCKCSVCEHLTEWDEGDIWECEECGETVCSDCIHKYNPEAVVGINQLEEILCKKCFNIKKNKKLLNIN